MPIYGKTDSESLEYSRPKFIGKLRKGAPQNEGLKNLDWFRFTSEQSYLIETFLAEYGEKPQKINIVLSGETQEEVFESWNLEYAKSSKSRWLRRKCDGRNIVLYLPPDSSRYSNEPMPCQKPNCNCKPTGKLYFYIRTLEGNSLLQGFQMGPVVLETHSDNEIRNISKVLHDWEKKAVEYGRPERLRDLPFVLERVKSRMGIPMFAPGTKEAKHGMRGESFHWEVVLYPHAVNPLELLIEQSENKQLYLPTRSPALPAARVGTSFSPKPIQQEIQEMSPETRKRFCDRIIYLTSKLSELTSVDQLLPNLGAMDADELTQWGKDLNKKVEHTIRGAIINAWKVEEEQGGIKPQAEVVDLNAFALKDLEVIYTAVCDRLHAIAAKSATKTIDAEVLERTDSGDTEDTF
ncbi:MAG: hypothetical protein WBB28_01745 [Crinalium sp.]